MVDNLLVLRMFLVQFTSESEAGTPMSAEKFPIPAWVEPGQRDEFAVRLAAFYHNKSGSLGLLSVDLKGSSSLLHMQLKANGTINVQTAIKLEELLGREQFPREFFRPDIFVAE